MSGDHANAQARRIVLASQSPRRTELLRQIGLPHDVAPADIDESHLPHEEPVPHAERLAREKALTLARAHVDAIVIGADTIVVLDGDILGKPASEDEAKRWLARLSGRTHLVHTAIAIARGEHVVSGVESVEVTFHPLSPREIDAYVATGEPMDKAGAYGIQGHGAVLVERIHGDYYAVMGLPLARLVRMLRDVGFEYDFGRSPSAG